MPNPDPAVPPQEPPPSEPASTPLDVSVIVPTFREVENLPLIVPRIAEVLASAGLDGEIVVVDDDSADGTTTVCETLAKTAPLRLHVRTEERGLSTAVIAGMRLAHGRVLVCMDADLSHPPEAIPELVATVSEGQADFAIGSRYVPGGSTDDDWGLFRWLNSQVATLLARPLTTARDPMAGFFALRSDRFREAAELDPIGYKIGLELLVKTDSRQVAEIPIHFRDRVHGESKLSFKEQLNYVRHVRKLIDYRFGIVGKLVRFAVVGSIGIAIDLLFFLLLRWGLNTEFPLARCGGILGAMLSNLMLHRVFTFGAYNDWQDARARQVDSVRFLICSTMAACINLGLSIWLVSSDGPLADRELLAVLAGILTAIGVNFLFCWQFLFRRRRGT